MMSSRLEGKVAAVLTERDLAINIGTQQGVTVGMKFKILANAPTEIRDPETNEVLDVIDREKVRVQVSEVRERMSICRTYRVRKTSAGPFYMGLGALTAAPESVPETLKADNSAYVPPLPEEESFVKRGDRVLQLLDAEG